MDSKWYVASIWWEAKRITEVFYSVILNGVLPPSGRKSRTLCKLYKIFLGDE